MSASTISTIIIVAFFVCLAFGFIKGILRSAIKSSVDFLVAIISITIPLPITKIFTRLLVDTRILGKLTDLLLEKLPAGADTYVAYIKEYLSNDATAKPITEIAELITALPTILLSPIFYILVFIIVFGILSVVAFLFKTIMCPKIKKFGFRLVGGIINALASAVMFAVIIIPIAGYSNFVGNVSQHCIEVIEANEATNNQEGKAIEASSDADTSKTQGAQANKIDLTGLKAPLNSVYEYAKPISDSPVSKMVYALGGRAIFNNLTTTKIDGTEIKLEVEANGIVDLLDAGLSFVGVEPKNYSTEQKDAINNANDAISESEYLALLSSKLISFVANEYYQGNDIMGIEKPNLGEKFTPILDDVLEVLKDTTSDDIRNDIRTISNIANGALEAGVISEVTSEQINIWKIIENKELVETIFVELYRNERTRNVIPFITSEVTNYVCEMYDDINSTSTDLGDFDYLNYSEETLALEAVYITTAIKEIHTFLEQAKLNEGFDPKVVIMESDLGALGRGLENLREGMFTERLFKLLLHAVLHSEAITETGVVDAVLINNAEKEDADLEGMLVARQNIMKLAIAIQEKQSSEKTKELMDNVIGSILEDEDNSLGTIVNKDNLTSLGMKEQDAESIEGIVGSMIDGAKDCEFETEEEKQEEIEKTETIISAVGNTVLDKTEDNMFTTDDNQTSTTNMTAQEFVDSVTDSKLTSSMIQSAVKDENGEMVNDPYKIQKELSAEDKEEISQAINNSYAQEDLTDDERATLEALANIFGVTIE